MGNVEDIGYWVAVDQIDFNIMCPECSGFITKIQVKILKVPVTFYKYGYFKDSDRVIGWTVYPCQHYLASENWILCHVPGRQWFARPDAVGAEIQQALQNLEE